MRKGSRYTADPSLDETVAAEARDGSLDETVAAAGGDVSLDETMAAEAGDGSLDETMAAEAGDGSLDETMAAAGVGAKEGAARKGAVVRGAALGRYVVLDLLGRGGMGEVYTAYDPDLDRKVALKVLRPAHARTSGASVARARLLREAQAVAKLSHPNVISVFDVGTVDGDVYVAMEYVEGGSVRDWLAAGPHEVGEILDVFTAAARGLAAAHREGMVHRDFKPDNVLVGRDGRVRVIDFGLVRHQSDSPADTDEIPASAAATRSVKSDLSAATTRAGAMMGTPAYMAPEQIHGQPTDARTDQFNFAASLYEALFGVRPFPIESLADLATRGEPLLPPADNDVPEWATRAVMRGLKADPEERFPSMEAMIDALAPQRRRRVGWIALAALACIIVVGGSVLFAAGKSGEPPCQDLGRKLHGVWDDARRAEVRDALMAAGGPHARTAWSRVEHLLDRYAASWIETRTAACRATAVEKTQSQEMLTRRMACLDRRQHRLDAAVTVLAGGDETMIDHAVQVVASLPPIDECSNASRLLASPKKATLPEVEKLIARAETLEAAGSYQKSYEVAVRAVAAAQKAGSFSHESVALWAKGLAEHKLGKAEAALETEFAAVRAAARANDAAAEAKAWVQVFVVALIGLRRFDEAARWSKHAKVAIEAAGGDIDLEARLHQSLGHLAYFDDRYDDALTHYRAAAALSARALGEDDWRVAVSINSIGSALRQKKRYKEAEAAHRKALAIIETQLGPDHPELTPTINSLAITLKRQEKFAEAKAAYERAIAIHREKRGDHHPRLATALNNLGLLHEAMGDYARAQKLLEECLAIREQVLPEDHPKLPKTRNTLERIRKKRNAHDGTGRAP